jgi:FkbM family methyltransferase
MNAQLDTTATAPPGAAWRACYWRLHGRGRKAWRDLALQRRLKNLRRQALAMPRYQPGRIALDDYQISYDDLLALYMEYKHIFAWGIYDFRPSGPRPLVLDCGSHIGLSVLRFKRIAPDCRIVAFEPDAAVLELLHENIRQNGLTGVDVVPAALAAAPGVGRFVADGADGGALARTDYAPASACAVSTVALADYLDEPVDLLKMNIEGAEWDVLRAAAPKLHNVRQMVVEYHGFPERGQKLHDILALLDECGFRYLIHHFDYETNARCRPPFRIDQSSRFFQLIAATRVWGRRARATALERCDSERPSLVVHGGPTLKNAECAPVSRQFGLDRGTPIDRHYIDEFLNGHKDDVAGRVLEVGNSEYTRRFGERRVTRADVLNLHPGRGTTVVADLTCADQIPTATYDCFVLTQTLPFIYDVRAAVATSFRILKPGGVLLLTVPGISQLSRYDVERWGDYWRFTPQSVQRLLAEQFGPANVTVRAYGNVRSAAALLDGRAAHELRPEELGHLDEEYPVIIAARAVKRGDAHE